MIRVKSYRLLVLSLAFVLLAFTSFGLEAPDADLQTNLIRQAEAGSPNAQANLANLYWYNGHFDLQGSLPVDADHPAFKKCAYWARRLQRKATSTRSAFWEPFTAMLRSWKGFGCSAIVVFPGGVQRQRRGFDSHGRELREGCLKPYEWNRVFCLVFGEHKLSAGSRRGAAKFASGRDCSRDQRFDHCRRPRSGPLYRSWKKGTAMTRQRSLDRRIPIRSRLHS